MTQFVDPRSNPEPPGQVPREPVAHGEELGEFIWLCSAGRLYDAERWIQEGGRFRRSLTGGPERRPGAWHRVASSVRRSDIGVDTAALPGGKQGEKARPWTVQVMASHVLGLPIFLLRFDII